MTVPLQFDRIIVFKAIEILYKHKKPTTRLEQVVFGFCVFNKVCMCIKCRCGQIQNCPVCKKEIYIIPAQRRRSKQQFCSKICFGKYNSGENSLLWKGGRTQDKRGYVCLINKTHPRNMSGYVYEHILKMEKKIGRYLLPNEQIHHINGNKSDNRLSNLKLCKDNQEHARYEFGWWKREDKWFKKCTICKKELEVNKENFYFRKNGTTIPHCKKCNIIKSQIRSSLKEEE